LPKKRDFLHTGRLLPNCGDKDADALVSGKGFNYAFPSGYAGGYRGLKMVHRALLVEC